MAETKKYRRPDGSTYRQYGGPKSAQDVEVKEGPSPSASPSPSPAPGTPALRQTSGKRETLGAHIERQNQEKAEEAVEQAETVEKVAPWLLEKPKQQEGGLGGAAARSRAKLKEMGNISAADAGDAVASDSEKKKKKGN